MSRGPYPILLVLAMSLPGAARALGLGDIRVESALNEPLTAQIDIVGASPEELASLTAKVATHEVFQRYGADRPAFLSSATFKVGTDAEGRPVFNVRSSESFSDPVVNFLVDLRWGNSELIREYSLLLDPAGYSPATVQPPAAAKAAPPANALAAAAPAFAAATGRPGRGGGIFSPETQEPAAAPGDTTRYRVAARDTLRRIAKHLGAGSELQTQRLMIAIFRANPHAFEGNINLLHRGALLIVPAAQDVAAVNGAEAKRQVRAQMLAWRLDGRPGTPHRAAMPAPVAGDAADAAATAALEGRVQSLQQALGDMHQQVAADDAAIADLKQKAAVAALSHKAAAAPVPASAAGSAAAPVPASAAAAKPVALAAPPAAAIAAAAAASPPAAGSAPAPVPVPASTAAAKPVALAAPPAAAVAAAAAASPPAAGSVPGKSAVHVEALHTEGALAPAVPAATPAFRGGPGLLAMMAAALALLLLGLAYFRRRSPHVLPDLLTAPVAGADSAAPDRAAVAELSLSEAQPAAQLAVPPAAAPLAAKAPTLPMAGAAATPVNGTKLRAAGEPTAESLAIDIEALERSYLDLGADALGSSETASRKPAQPAAASRDSGAVDLLALDMSELEADVAKTDLQTAVIEAPKLEGASLNDMLLDYNLVDLDATAAQYVQMSGDLRDQPVVADRRTNITDVLRAAIDRDPHRRDLRMKLLETYHDLATANHRAFMDVVDNLSREREFLSPDDWKKVVTMGRQIAPDNILFSAASQDDDLAHCA